MTPDKHMGLSVHKLLNTEDNILTVAVEKGKN